MRLADYAALIEGATCRFHQEPEPLPAKVDHYPHEGGWIVEGMTGKQWLSVTCEKCGYAWSLWKLGVSREPETEKSANG